MIVFLINLNIVLMYIYIMSRISKQSIIFKNPVIVTIIIISTAIISSKINFPTEIHLSIPVHLVIYIIMTKLLFKNNWRSTLFLNFISFIIIGVLDTLTGLFMIGVLGFSFEQLTTNDLIMLNSNLVAFLILIIFFNFKYITNNILKVIQLFNIDKSKLILYLSALILIIISLITYNSYYSINELTEIIITTLMLFSFFVLLIMIIKEKNESVKKELENEILVNNLSEYEKMLERNLINNHEHKNSLLVIKGMSTDDNDKIQEYIDTIINERYADDESLLYKTSKFPIGGLQGLVYQKILAMKSKNIDFHLEIGRGISKEIFKNVSTKTNYDICTIIGVHLDNSIEAVENLTKKNISIYAYIDSGNFKISICNNFKGVINLNKISEEKYSTKGKNRGYGLAIVKKIVNKNPDISVTREVTGDVFKQILTLKL